MAKEFLRGVAELFVSVAGERLQDYCFVFPNRRSSLFFRRYIGDSVKTPVFSPRLTNINDLFVSLSGLKVADRITLLARLYDVFRSKVSGFAETFDDFIFRGEVILGDFDDIDKYLVDAKRLFANIRDLKEIDDDYSYLTENQRKAIASFWGVLNEFRENKKEVKFLGMWDELYGIYETFRTELRKDGLAYEGMIYRDVAERIAVEDSSVLACFDRYEQVVFVGLNAPNNCEKKLFDALQKCGKGNFYWDFYGDAVRDVHNKSSLFMKENVLRYPSVPALPGDVDPGSSHPQVEVITVPSAAGQAKYLYSILSEMGEDQLGKDLISTSVVLPDETLLLPVLNSIPQKITTVNVTMGYTLSNSEVFSFICRLCDLQERMVEREEDGPMFHYRDVLGLTSHSFLKNSFPEKVEQIRKQVYDENMIYIPSSMFEGEELLEVLFQPVKIEDSSTAAPMLTEYMKRSIDIVSKYAGRIDQEFLYCCYKNLNLLGRLRLPLRKDTYFRLLRRVISTVSVPFAGEPLAGLQVMGPLETRALDFETIIILSVNEGTFPSGSIAPSIVPYNLRRGFGLPTYEYQDSISAYHFYRSICRAKKVILLCDSRAGGLQSGEESRYVKQLEYLYKYNIVRKSVSFEMEPPGKAGEGSVEKTSEDIAVLEKMVFSPSSLGTYLSCPMKFYFRYVLKMDEQEELAEGVDSSSFGSIYHWLMQHIYERGRQYDAASLRELARKVEGQMGKLIPEAFKEVMKVRRISGKNLIAGEMLSRMVVRTLERDADVLPPFRIEATEGKVPARFVTESGRKVDIKGIVDRIDVLEGYGLRVLDYKTGRKHFDFREIADLFDPEKADGCSHIFQLYFYLLLFDMAGKLKTGVDGVLLEISYTSDLFGEDRNYIVAETASYEEFRQGLSGLLEEIFNPQIPFTRTAQIRNCDYCPFLPLCGK